MADALKAGSANMDSPTRACIVCATALWAGILVAGFSSVPEGPNGWQPTANSKLLNRAARPDVHRPAVARVGQ